MGNTPASQQRLRLGLSAIGLMLSGVWVVSAVFALTILADALVLLAVRRSAPVASEVIRACFVATAVFVLWLGLRVLTRASQFSAVPRFSHVLFICFAIDLAFWAVAPALAGLEPSLWLTYGIGAVIGSAGYATRRSRLTRASS